VPGDYHGECIASSIGADSLPGLAQLLKFACHVLILPNNLQPAYACFLIWLAALLLPGLLHTLLTSGLPTSSHACLDARALAASRTGPPSWLHSLHAATMVAGIIGAVGNNNPGAPVDLARATGIVGVCWDVRLISARFLVPTVGGSTANAVRALDYLIDLKRRGLNIVASRQATHPEQLCSESTGPFDCGAQPVAARCVHAASVLPFRCMLI